MPVTCQTIMNAMEAWAPQMLAESWDNTGLLLGSSAQSVNKVMATLDVTEEVAEEAIAADVQMIIAHHPTIFKGITSICSDNPQGRLLSLLLKHDIAVYAAHTNLDTAEGGVNDVLASKLQLQDIKPLSVTTSEKMLKLVVFVPESHLEQVRSAITAAGAGHIGNYSHCTFAVAGKGTFLPLAGSHPFLGQQGQLEIADEYRLETILPENMSRRVLKAMLKTHPYEEVAYDMIPLQNSGASFGLGRIGELAESMPFFNFAQYVKRVLQLDFVKAAGDLSTAISSVAVCGGSGSSLISKALSAGADVLVTGDVKYHEAQQAVAAGMTIIDAGHFGTEQPTVLAIAQYLAQCGQKAQWEVEVLVSQKHKDIFYIR